MLPSSSNRNGLISLPSPSSLAPSRKDSERSPSDSESCPDGPLSPSASTNTTDISSLPVELLIEIFLAAHDYKTSSATHDQRSVPINLTQTCGHWRRIALGMPLLWCNLWLSKLCPDNLDLWISRAKGFPLQVKFASRLHHQEKLWGTMRGHVHQLEHVVFSRDFLYRAFLPSLEPGVFSSLKSAEWCISRSWDDDEAFKHFEGFWEHACSARLLRKARLMDIPQNAPWSQLTQLDLFLSPFHPTINALSQCQNLTKLSWFMSSDWQIRNLTSLLLPNLIEFSVTCAFGGSRTRNALISFFDCLDLPSLSCLSIDWRGDMSKPLKSVEELLIRSKAKLEYFHVPHVTDKNVNSIIQFLETPILKHLRSLAINVFDNQTGFWERMEKSSFLPCLRKLRFATQRDNDTEIILVAFQERRRQCTTSLAPLTPIQVVLSLYEQDPMEGHIDKEEEAEFLENNNTASSWRTLSSQLADISVEVDFVPWAFYIVFQ